MNNKDNEFLEWWVRRTRKIIIKSLPKLKYYMWASLTIIGWTFGCMGALFSLLFLNAPGLIVSIILLIIAWLSFGKLEWMNR